MTREQHDEAAMPRGARCRSWFVQVKGDEKGRGYRRHGPRWACALQKQDLLGHYDKQIEH